MTLVWSAPNGFAIAGWRRVLIAGAAAWLAPAVFGLLVLGVLRLLGLERLGDTGLILWALGVLFVLSPVLSWMGLVAAAPLVAVLMDRGWFGWLPAIALGMAVGAAIGLLMGNDLGVTFGAAMLGIFRAVLGRLSPEAFAGDADPSG